MNASRVDLNFAQKMALLRDDIQLSILVALSVFFCLATIALVGSDLLFGAPLFKAHCTTIEAPARATPMLEQK